MWRFFIYTAVMARLMSTISNTQSFGEKNLSQSFYIYTFAIRDYCQLLAYSYTPLMWFFILFFLLTISHSILSLFWSLQCKNPRMGEYKYCHTNISLLLTWLYNWTALQELLSNVNNPKCNVYMTYISYYILLA